MEYIAAVIAGVVGAYLLAGLLFFAFNRKYPEVIYEWGWWLYKSL